MIAEIKGKISSYGSNLNDRLEDDLTGNVFGNLRYMSFNNGLKQILMQGIYPRNLAKIIENINEEEWNQFIKFWPYDEEGELDVLINFKDTIIGIEVKYLSGLSSRDDVDNYDLILDETSTEKVNDENSKNQLSREARIISRLDKSKNKILIFIAKDRKCQSIYKEIREEPIIKKDVKFAYISWQSILNGLENLKINNPYEKVIISDLSDLLIRKGFENFKDFKLEDIVEDSWYDFGTVKNSIISFDMKKNVDGELYYEFR